MSNILFVGIDVAKNSLQIALENSNFSIPNTLNGINSLIKKLNSLSSRLTDQKIQIILESTGGYELLLMITLQSASFAVSRVNPKQMRDFARASKILAKTDKIDAAVIKQFGEKMNPEVSELISESQIALNDRVNRREQLLAMCQAEKNRLERTTDKSTLNCIKKVIKYLTQQIKQAEAAIDQLVKENKDFVQRIQTLTNIIGIGKITALCLTARMPELGSLKRGTAASLAGLAPFNHDSGSSIKGYRSIKAGRAAVRKTLYMPAIAAKKHHPTLSLFYCRLIKAGKKPKIALVAVMRKLIELCNAVLKPRFCAVASAKS